MYVKIALKTFFKKFCSLMLPGSFLEDDVLQKNVPGSLWFASVVWFDLPGNGYFLNLRRI